MFNVVVKIFCLIKPLTLPAFKVSFVITFNLINYETWTEPKFYMGVIFFSHLNSLGGWELGLEK